MTHYMLELGLWILLAFFVGCMMGCIFYRAGRPQGEPLAAPDGKTASASRPALRSPVPDSADPGLPAAMIRPSPPQAPASAPPPVKAEKPAPHVTAPAAPVARRETPAQKPHTFPATSRGPAAAYVAPKPPAKPAPVPVEKPVTASAPAKLVEQPAAKVPAKAAPKRAVAKPVPAKTAPTKAAAPASKPKGPAKPKGIAKARGGKPDNLQRLSGVGPKNEKVLHKLGFFHFDQIAGWTAAEIDWVDDHLKFGGRIRREEWVKQAKLLAAGKDAEFAKLYGTGGMKNAAGETKSGTRTRRR